MVWRDAMYAINGQVATHAGASAVCQSLGAALPSIRSEAENEAVREFALVFMSKPAALFGGWGGGSAALAHAACCLLGAQACTPPGNRRRCCAVGTATGSATAAAAAAS
jgi:hypothetical protein